MKNIKTFILSSLLVIFLLGTLGIILFIQIRWSNSLFIQERVRLETEITRSTIEAASMIEDEIILLSNVAKTRSTNETEIIDRLIRAIDFWDSHSIAPDLIENIFLVDIATPNKVFLVNGSDVTILSDNDAWKIYNMTTEIASRENPKNNSLYISIPNIGEFILSSISQNSDSYYLLTFINIEVLSNVVIPTIVNQVFTDKGMYKYRILNIDRQQVIFASDDSPNSAYNRPDFSWVFFSGPNPYNSGLYKK